MKLTYRYNNVLNAHDIQFLLQLLVSRATQKFFSCVERKIWLGFICFLTVVFILIRLWFIIYYFFDGNLVGIFRFKFFCAYCTYRDSNLVYNNKWKYKPKESKERYNNVNFVIFFIIRIFSEIFELYSDT